MKNKYLLLTFLTIVISTTIYAEKDKNGCELPRDFVKHMNMKDSNIFSQNWKDGVDHDSDEYTATQYLVFKNGDLAVIEHKYCSMYNYELSYFVADDNFKITPKDIGKLISEIHSLSAVIKPNFKTPLDSAIQTGLEKSNFSSAKPISLGLNISNNGNKNIEQSVNYINLENNSSIYKSMIGYYLGVGGIP